MVKDEKQKYLKLEQLY